MSVPKPSIRIESRNLTSPIPICSLLVTKAFSVPVTGLRRSSSSVQGLLSEENARVPAIKTPGELSLPIPLSPLALLN